MTPTTAKHRTLILALAALLAWPWPSAAAIVPDEGSQTETATAAGSSRMMRGQQAPIRESYLVASTGIVVADDDSESPLELPSSPIHNWSYFGMLWGSASNGPGTIRDPGQPRSRLVPRRLRC